MSVDDAGSPHHPRRWRRALLVLGVLGLLVVVVAAGFAFYLNNLISANVRHADLLPHEGERRVQRDSAGKDAQNILLLGSDSTRDAVGKGSRSDVIQLVHISSDRHRLDVVHVPRDMYVPIPGHGTNKINAAYALGGAPLLVLTLEDLLRVHIDHVAAISFRGFKQLTDRLGGVEVYVRQPSDEYGYRFRTGLNHVNGDEALALVRQRHQLALGDIDRGKRQQAWMHAVMKKLLQTNLLTKPVKLTGVINDLTRNMVVDESMSTSYIRSLALGLRGLTEDDVHFHTAPYDGFDSVAGVGSIDRVDEQGMERLGRALRADTMAQLPGGTTRPG